MRFCGLLGLLNIVCFPFPCYKVTVWVARGWFEPVS